MRAMSASLNPAALCPRLWPGTRDRLWPDGVWPWCWGEPFVSGPRTRLVILENMLELDFALSGEIWRVDRDPVALLLLSSRACPTEAVSEAVPLSVFLLALRRCLRMRCVIRDLRATSSGKGTYIRFTRRLRMELFKQQSKQCRVNSN